MKTYRIHEIFLTLQGEGYHTGCPAVFVRFSGCNLRCPFCDTDFASFRELTADDILAEVQRLSPAPQTLIILTGGEPSLQVDAPLLRVLHTSGKTICIETNGTHPLPDGIDWITCSPKQGTRVVLPRADELKIVYLGQDDSDANEQQVEPWRTRIPADHLFLQPCSCTNTPALIAYILRHPHWRLSLQTHKYIDID